MYELMPAEYNDLRRAFDELRYGQMSPTPLVGVGQLTQHDPSRAPPGKAIFHAWDYVPYERPDGRSWDEAKPEFAEKVITRMGDFIENLPEVILDYHCDSPVDMERTSPSFLRGDLHGIATTTYQSGSHRPTPELGQYRVPGVERLYLVGPFQHPGGGVFGAGRATAMVMAEDLGIEFDGIKVA
jgi:phytoene dehydrogenase-like protein